MKKATHAEVKPRKLRLGLSKIIITGARSQILIWRKAISIKPEVRVGKDTEDQTRVTLLRREDIEDQTGVTLL